jgi:hypothetical protein
MRKSVPSTLDNRKDRTFTMDYRRFVQSFTCLAESNLVLDRVFMNVFAVGLRRSNHGFGLDLSILFY